MILDCQPSVNQRSRSVSHVLPVADQTITEATKASLFRLEAIVALLILVATAPLSLTSMALIKLTSPGPTIYSQVRVGRSGRLYRIYKIRSMSHDCERHSGVQWSVGRDSRVTPVGRILRKLHLDELPQLWNVIRGEMSLVGPRPERPEFVVQLEKVIPHYRDRLEVRPGITGLAQVQLPPDTDLMSVQRKLACDLTYLDHRSLWLDLRILVGTALLLVHMPVSWTQRLLRFPTGRTQPRCAQENGRDLVVAGLLAS